MEDMPWVEIQEARQLSQWSDMIMHLNKIIETHDVDTETKEKIER